MNRFTIQQTENGWTIERFNPGDTPTSKVWVELTTQDLLARLEELLNPVRETESNG